MPSVSGLSHVGRLLVCAVLLLVPLFGTAEDWPTYLRDPGRSAASQETWLSTANASSLTKLWSFNTGDVIAASPTVVNNVVYVGSWNGYEYAINAQTGALIWKTFLGTDTPGSECSPDRALGVTSAATVQNGVVYVGGGDDYWYALNASSGNILWKVYVGDSTAAGGNYNWSSPLIYNGYGYIGVASFGDCPLVQGKLLKVDLATQQVVGTYDVVPNGTLGGGIWSSPTLDTATGIIYVATGTRTLPSQPQAQAIVAINSATMALQDSWAIQFPQPVIADADFGVTPTLFTDSKGDQLVAAANKNGVLYALRRSNMSAGPVWTDQIADGGASPQYGQGTVSSGIYANGMLFQAGGQVTVNGTLEQGSVDAIDPDNGNFIWRHYTPNAIIPALASINGLVLDAEGPTLEVLNAATGNPLYSYTTGAVIYSAPSISNGRIFFGSGDGNLYALGLPSSAVVGTATPTPAATALPAPGPLASLYNNAGTVTDGVVSTSNFDGYGYSYSAQALAAAGITRGGTVMAGGLSFTWPNVPLGGLDNVIAAGQTIVLPTPTGGTTLGFLGAAASGPSGGTATVTYTDGSRQTITLAFSDWALGAVPGVQPLPGTSIVADMDYRDNAAGIPDPTAVYIFYVGFSLEAGKTVQSVTLPSSVNGGPIHIFALAVGTPSASVVNTPTAIPTQTTGGGTTLAAAFNNAGTVSDGVSSDSDFDGYGYSYSAQALAAAGIAPGGTVAAGGLTFTWPNVAPGKPDNVEAGAVESGGQTITLPAPPGATTLGFLGAATTGPTGGVGTITYTDGTSQDFKLQFSDWAFSAASGVQPLPGTSIVATMRYRDTASGAPDPIPVYVFYTGFSLAPGKTVRSVTLPSAVVSGSIHVFAMTIGTPGSTAPINTPIATPTIPVPAATSTPYSPPPPPPSGGGGGGAPPGGSGGGGIYVPPIVVTNTPVPTVTDTATVIPTQTPTNTPVPPTSTPGQIVLAPPPPTWTATVPPTATATATPRVTRTRVRTPAPARVPKLMIHNAPQLAVGGRSSACSSRQNSAKKQQPGCEIVWTNWLPGAKITYVVRYPNGSRQTVTQTADRTGHAQQVFNIRYLPPAHGKRTPTSAIATITVRAVSKKGGKAGPVSVRFTILSH
jgi:outer membrane protein assembly factor BamB